MVYALQDEWVYGPVLSRRYGVSLGVNLSPRRAKVCSFDCVYCHYGRTRHRTIDLAGFADELPSRAAIERDLERALLRAGPLQQMTFSGNGEPTLHPDFAAIVDAVVALRDRHRPQAKVAVLSNSSALDRPAVRAALARVDLPVLKLDAGTESTFRAINCPDPRVKWTEIIDRLIAQPDVVIQTVLLDGNPSNTEEDELAAYCDLLDRIRPVAVHLHSIDRPVAARELRLVPPGRLAEIAAMITRRTGLSVQAFGAS